MGPNPCDGGGREGRRVGKFSGGPLFYGGRGAHEKTRDGGRGRSGNIALRCTLIIIKN